MRVTSLRRRGVGWKPVEFGGYRFISQGEADRYIALAARHPDLRVETADALGLLVCTTRTLVETFRLAQGSAGNKHHAKRTMVDGIWFASQHEAARYSTLRMRERAGEIVNLQPHPVYEFIINGVRVGQFTLDFEYTIATGPARGEVITEDAKYIGTKKANGRKTRGTKTEAYQLRKKLLWACHRITVTEVFAA